VDDSLLTLLEKLAAFGDENDSRETARPKRMLNVTPDTGRLLWILTRALRATRILEVGTSNAFSTIWLADAVKSNGGRVTTLEFNPEKTTLAQTNLTAAGLENVVDIVEGRAIETLPALPGPFDIVFLDADRSGYAAYLEILMPKLLAGGLLIADNATSHPEELQEFFERVDSHPQLFAVTLPIGKGEYIALKIREGA
jgi:predicted O-methyltransferase YrrM